jgi:hypothetical protein
MAYGGLCVETHVFFISALVGGKCSASRSSRFIPVEKAPCTICIGGWVGTVASLGDMEKGKFLTLPRLKLRPFGHPTRSKSHYRLRTAAVDECNVEAERHI